MHKHIKNKHEDRLNDKFNYSYFKRQARDNFCEELFKTSKANKESSSGLFISPKVGNERGFGQRRGGDGAPHEGGFGGGFNNRGSYGGNYRH